MGYSFDRDAPVQKDVRRIALAQIGSALESIDDHGRDSDVVIHEVRKTAKKLRGLIRMVRPGFAQYKAENAAFRDIGLILSPLRDAAVLIETHDALMATCEGEAERAALAPVRRRLTVRQKLLDRDATGADRKLGDARDLLLAARARVAGWQFDDSGFDALADGLAKTYKRARKAMKEAQRGNDADAIHEWRKLVKYHSYHARLLEPVWPAAMQAHRQLADQLNDLLGYHHDLAVFEATLRGGDFGTVDIETLAVLIHKRQAMFATQAFALGARLFAEPADRLTQRWQSYWTQWRNAPGAASAA